MFISPTFWWIVGITGLEPATSSSRTTCATNCAKSRFYCFYRMTMQRYMKNGIQPNKNAFFCSFLKDFLEKICWNQKKCVPLHPQMRNRLLFIVGAIAQLVEQRTENPCVPGSIPGGTTPPFIWRFLTSVRAAFFYNEESGNKQNKLYSNN